MHSSTVLYGIASGSVLKNAVVAARKIILRSAREPGLTFVKLPETPNRIAFVRMRFVTSDTGIPQVPPGIRARYRANDR